ncbi:type VI secretion system tube protein Hcp [Danxiaibacter flavus]|uniref:Type VI secretion system tube protein Hcp n=1 Tax=Danxiaibacter flavus TaxID=3049108 RepID=A0ABV3ZPV6_9BACT|nr:type VI secretion system tube protein Hcp [Chitinophagaceae bacterium DXS]
MSVEIFLKLDGINGESMAKGHENWIEILTYSWGIREELLATNTGGTAVAGKAVFSDVALTKILDSSSIPIRIHCASAKRIPNAILDIVLYGNYPEPLYQVKLYDVIITGVGSSANEGVEKPRETLSLNYARIEWSYSMQDIKGNIGTPIKGGWDVKKNIQL